MSNNIKFIYCDARGIISYREITNISKTEDYIQGYCSKENGFRTFRKDRVLEYIDEGLNVDQRLKYHIETSPPPQRISPSRTCNRCLNVSSAPEICFTGFKKEDKMKLVKQAELAGIFNRNSVTKHLVYLCCGYNAGPKKIEKSRHQGAIILNESQFSKMLETGEIPEK